MRIRRLKQSIAIMSLCAVTWMTAGTAALAATDLVVPVNQSHILDLAGGISRIAVANPAIADVTVTSGQQILVVAKAAGSTSLYIWDQSGMRHDYSVAVTDQDVATGKAIQQIIGYDGVKVDKIGSKILLSGTVKDQEEQQRANAIAKMYGSDVVDMLTLTAPMQVNIEARIVEINKNKDKDIGVNWGSASDINTDTGVVTVNSGSFSFGQYKKFSALGYSSAAPLMATLSFLVDHGDAKILSQPHVMTMSGQKANILIGGEMPVPTTNSNGSTNVEWKNYGIELSMEPVADEDGVITSKVMVSVSTLNATAGTTINGTTIKGLTTRKAETVISLPSGQTMVIGGLLSTEDTKSINKIPLLGDIPILGRLFRDVSESHEEKELLIFITPTLVNNTTTARVSDMMEQSLHTITRDEQQMPSISRIQAANTVIAKDEYAEEDAAAVAKQAKKKEKQARKKEKDKGKWQPQDTAPAAGTADSGKSAGDTSDAVVTPVALDTYMGPEHTAEGPGLLKQKLAALRAAGKTAASQNS